EEIVSRPFSRSRGPATSAVPQEDDAREARTATPFTVRRPDDRGDAPAAFGASRAGGRYGARQREPASAAEYRRHRARPRRQSRVAQRDRPAGTFPSRNDAEHRERQDGTEDGISASAPRASHGIPSARSDAHAGIGRHLLRHRPRLVPHPARG